MTTIQSQSRSGPVHMNAAAGTYPGSHGATSTALRTRSVVRLVRDLRRTANAAASQATSQPGD